MLGQQLAWESGTLGYVIAQRRREVGLRIAVGAVPRRIAVHFVLEAARVVGLACFAGLALAVLFAQTLSGMLYGVSPRDPFTLIAVVAMTVRLFLGAGRE